jgi:hypothetical protein
VGEGTPEPRGGGVRADSLLGPPPTGGG